MFIDYVTKLTKNFHLKAVFSRQISIGLAMAAMGKRSCLSLHLVTDMFPSVILLVNVKLPHCLSFFPVSEYCVRKSQ
jgi:hypothetical protein